MVAPMEAGLNYIGQISGCARVAIPPCKPRRVVDLQKLNQAFLRQMHPMKAPFLQCMAVSLKSTKTVLDAWYGYHSLPLREKDQHLTTFLMPWGRYKYCNLLQGHMAAGDAYTAR